MGTAPVTEAAHPTNETHHRVYLPGPHIGKPEVVDHTPDCDTTKCPVEAGIKEWLASEPPDDWDPRDKWPYIAVQGDYFTTDGKSYQRCEWQTRHRA